MTNHKTFNFIAIFLLLAIGTFLFSWSLLALIPAILSSRPLNIDKSYIVTTILLASFLFALSEGIWHLSETLVQDKNKKYFKWFIIFIKTSIFVCFAFGLLVRFSHMLRFNE